VKRVSTKNSIYAGCGAYRVSCARRFFISLLTFSLSSPLLLLKGSVPLTDLARCVDTSRLQTYIARYSPEAVLLGIQ